MLEVRPRRFVRSSERPAGQGACARQLVRLAVSNQRLADS